MKNQTKGIKAVLLREINILKTKPIYWVMMLLIPLISFTFFTTLLNKGLPSRMPIGIVNLDNTSLSRTLAHQLDATQQCHIVSNYSNFDDAKYAMQQGEIYAFVVIPKNFQAEVFSGKQPNVPFYVQNAYFIGGALLMKDITFTLANVSAGINLKTQLAKGQSEAAAIAQIQPIKTNINEMTNSWVNYSVYLSTIMLPGILQIIILIVTVFSVGTELKHKTSQQWLITANKSILKAIIGKLIPYTVVFTILAIFANVLMFKMLGFPFLGSFWQMGLGIILFVLAQQAFGVIIIGLIPSLRDSLSAVAIVGTLGLSFSGLTFPVEGMPLIFQSWCSLFPLRHYFLIYVSQALTGAGMTVSYPSYLALIGICILSGLVLLRLKKSLVRQNYPIN